MTLLLITLFLVLAVFMRAGIQWVRTKDLGLRTASLDAPPIEILPGTIFVLSFCVALAVALFGFYGKLAPVMELPLILQWLSFALGLSGILITVISQYQMGDSWRIGVDQQETTELKTQGLYARSRNPIYFGLLLFWVGICGTFVHALLMMAAIICWICIELIVRKIEEPYLHKTHGEMFVEYVRSTNRYLPIL